MTELPGGSWPPPPPAGWGPPQAPGPGSGWGPPAPHGWGQAPLPQPPPPPRSWTGLFVGLIAAVIVAVLLAGVVVVTTVSAIRSSDGAGRQASRRGASPPVSSSASAAAGRPRIGRDHWHVRYEVFLCDRLLAPVQGNGDQGGIHSHGDGSVHVEPAAPGSAGANATFRRFEEAEGLQITSTSLRWVDGTVPVAGQVSDGCNGRPAEIVTFVDGNRTVGPPGDIRLRDGQTIVVALAPIGTQESELGFP